ncbi:hypothetical protein BDB01DRAFT_549711 [Pilobolus umbonatus]|nr:hypothetical protein BDB01DRAFT_549711 [Pilobolus umbonatus]
MYIMEGIIIVEEVVTNIEISGPTSFTKTFNMKLPVNASCPTVDASGESFGIEYMIRVIVNLNEENPHRPEDPHDIVTFNMPFTVGTHPKLTFNIDDDGEEEEMKLSDNASEDDIAELIEGLDVGNDENGSNTDTTPVKEEEVTGSNFLAKASYPPASAKLDILPPIVMTASVSETINNSSTNGYPKMPNALGRRKSANWVVPTPMGQSPPTNTFPGQYPPTMLPAGTTPRPFPSRPLYPQAVNHYPPRPSPQFTPQIPYPRPDTYRPQDAYPPQDTYRPQSTFPGMMPPPSVSFPSENAFPTMQFPVPNPDGYGSTPVSSYAVFNYNAYPQHQNHPNAFN